MPKQTKLSGDPNRTVRALEPAAYPSTCREALPRDTNPSAPALLTGLTALYGAYAKPRGA